MKKNGEIADNFTFYWKKKLPNYCLKHSKGTQKYHLKNGNFFRENNICEERYPFISLKRRAKGRSFEDGYSTQANRGKDVMNFIIKIFIQNIFYNNY